MYTNARNRLVASGFGLPAALEALVLAPWIDATTELNLNRVMLAARPGDGADPTPAPEGAAPGESRGATATAPVNSWVPAVDVEEGEDAIRLAFEVPGVAPDALSVTVDEGVLTVSGERAVSRREGARGRSAYHLERRFGRFARSVTLPRTVDPERIAARYEHGVLHLELPKRAESQPRRISIATTPAMTQPSASQIESGESSQS